MYKWSRFNMPYDINFRLGSSYLARQKGTYTGNYGGKKYVNGKEVVMIPFMKRSWFQNIAYWIWAIGLIILLYLIIR